MVNAKRLAAKLAEWGVDLPEDEKTELAQMVGIATALSEEELANVTGGGDLPPYFMKTLPMWSNAPRWEPGIIILPPREY